MATKTYSVGWNNTYVLKDKGNTIKNILNMDEDVIIKIVCEKEEKSMKVTKISKETKTDWIEEGTEVKEGDTIDISDSGMRWEGNTLRGEPFQYGCYYDENNQLVYSGFIFEKKKVCYGTEYYSDTSMIEYCGTFYNGLRHGQGCLYDKEGKVMYEGIWRCGEKMEYTLTVNDKCEDDSMIHNLLTAITIGSDCFKEQNHIELNGYPVLTSIKVGDRSFYNARSCTLKSIVNNFNNY